MKQITQSIGTGDLTVQDVPSPAVHSRNVVVRVYASLISAGTERTLVEFAEKDLLQKARSRPDLVREVLDKARRDGILTTLEALQNRMDRPIALGYSCAGTVVEVGPGTSAFQTGDRVACAGGGYAVHAEVVNVPRNLVIKLPDNVDFESATFTTLGAVALQGTRLAEVKLGEVVVVIGLGLLGQLVTQMLKAAGCIVLGLDIRPQRVELARYLGADVATANTEEFSALCRQLSSGHGADAVLITADTPSSQPVQVAGEVARDKGIVVAVGAVGMTIPRKVYYEKELDFRVSRSYGPGRYDTEYEEKGHDYPYAYVRWTEQRNMQAFVQLLADGKVNVKPLITHRFPIDDAPNAYDVIKGKTNQPFLGVLLTYPNQPDLARRVTLREVSPVSPPNLQRVRLGIVGAGNFANVTLLPVIRSMPDIDLIGIAAGTGMSARVAADRFGFAYCTTDVHALINDPTVNTIAILTRHHLHASQVIAALEARKHVFVEKPLCLNEEELEAITSVYQTAQGSASLDGGQSPRLLIGFNRRFAPFVKELKQHLQRVQEPLVMHYRVNAGYIPSSHWTQDPKQGGGRLLGEVCHFIDLLLDLSGSRPRRITTCALPDSGRYSRDNLLITLEFVNGSLGNIIYVANGNKSFGKECLEVFGGGLATRLDDYRTLMIREGNKTVSRTARLRADKGHRAELQAWIACLTGKGEAPIAFEEIVRSTQATLAAQRSLESGVPVMLDRGHL